MKTFKKIGRNIRNIRERKNLTQQDVVNLLNQQGINISRETFSKIENGKRSISVIEIQAIAKVLNVNVEEFFDQLNLDEESLVVLFRKRKPLDKAGQSFLSELQNLIKNLIHQEKVWEGEIKNSQFERVEKGAE